MFNKISNDGQCINTSYYEEKCMIFLWKFINFEIKEVLGLGFSEKQQSEVNKFWQPAKQGSHFSMILKFYKQVLLLSKSFQNLWLNFLKNGNFVPHTKIQSKSIFFLFLKFFFCKTVQTYMKDPIIIVFQFIFSILIFRVMVIFWSFCDINTPFFDEFFTITWKIIFGEFFYYISHIIQHTSLHP